MRVSINREQCHGSSSCSRTWWTYLSFYDVLLRSLHLLKVECVTKAAANEVFMLARRQAVDPSSESSRFACRSGERRVQRSRVAGSHIPDSGGAPGPHRASSIAVSHNDDNLHRHDRWLQAYEGQPQRYARPVKLKRAIGCVSRMKKHQTQEPKGPSSAFPLSGDALIRV